MSNYQYYTIEIAPRMELNVLIFTVIQESLQGQKLMTSLRPEHHLYTDHFLRNQPQCNDLYNQNNNKVQNPI